MAVINKVVISFSLLVIVLVAVLLALPSGKNRLDKGLDAYNRGDYATALLEFRPLAENGLASAQNNLGAMFQAGLGVPQDYTAALKWYRLAVEQSYATD